LTPPCSEEGGLAKPIASQAFYLAIQWRLLSLTAIAGSPDWEGYAEPPKFALAYEIDCAPARGHVSFRALNTVGGWFAIQ